MQTLRHIVIGTDFSECAELALDTAIMLAGCALARVTVVHVCELESDDPEDQLLHRCSEDLTRLVATRQQRGVEVTAVLRSGKPWEKLNNVAAEVGASLIVIGRHGTGHGQLVELGSVADRLIRCASRAVLTVALDAAHIARAAGNP
jgi:universal stress protein E